MKKGGKTFFTISLLVCALICPSLLSSSVYAFDTDTHYYLKYYLLRKVGFCTEQATIIAKADESTDYGDSAPGFFNEHNNVAWHAMASPDENAARQSELWNIAIGAYGGPGSLEQRLAPFGQFLHFLEDRTSHEGYGWRLGHGLDGHLPDYLSYYSMDTVEQAVSTWLEYMKEFLKMTKGIEPNPVTWEDVKDTVSKVRDANPFDETRVYLDFYNPPEASKARDVINGALQLEIDPFESIGSTFYEYDENGTLIGTLPLGLFSITSVQQACNNNYIQNAITVISNSPSLTAHPETSVAIQWLTNFTDEQKAVDPSLNSLRNAITNLTGLAHDDVHVLNETTNLTLLMQDCLFKKEKHVLYLRIAQDLSGCGSDMDKAYAALALAAPEMGKMKTNQSDVNFDVLTNSMVIANEHLGDAERDALKTAPPVSPAPISTPALLFALIVVTGVGVAVAVVLVKRKTVK